MADEQLSNKQQLVFHLIDKGLGNEEIARTLADVAESAFEQFTNEAMSIFTQEDKDAIENAPSDLDADDEIKKRFTEKTGKDAVTYLESLIEEHAASYLSDELRDSPQGSLN